MTRWKQNAKFSRTWATWPKATSLDGIKDEQWLRSILQRAGIPCSSGYNPRTGLRTMVALRGPDAGLTECLRRVLQHLRTEDV